MTNVSDLEMRFQNLYYAAANSSDPELHREIMKVKAAIDSIRYNCCDSCQESTHQVAVEMLYNIEKKLKDL